jgi:hypothetical protein
MVLASLIFASFTCLRPTLTSYVSRAGRSSSDAALVSQAGREFDEIDRFLCDGDFRLINADRADPSTSTPASAPNLVTTRGYLRPTSPFAREGSPGILEVRQEVFGTAEGAQRRLSMLRCGALGYEPYDIAHQPEHGYVVGSNVYLVRYGPFDHTQQGENLCNSLWAMLAGLGPDRVRA